MQTASFLLLSVIVLSCQKQLAALLVKPCSFKRLHSMSSLAEVLKSAASSCHVVIGNQAGDADSIVSAIAWAYLETKNNRPKRPIVSISKSDLETQRPETKALFRKAHLDTNVLDYVDSGKFQNVKEITLVDHNRLTVSHIPGSVVEILDHHLDEQDHSECTKRDIAFENDKALVASTCSLIVERIQDYSTITPHLSTLLLGVILLDSVNLNPAAGKVTQRDRDAVTNLLQQTQWTKDQCPDPNALYKELQQAKFDATFWKSLSVRDALRLDYKLFSASIDIGMSSVLMQMIDFMDAENFKESLEAYRKEQGVQLLVVMLAHDDGGKGGLRRELLLSGTTDSRLDELAAYLCTETTSLELIEKESSTVGTLRCFTQGNTRASRKAVAPILLQYYSKKE